MFCKYFNNYDFFNDVRPRQNKILFKMLICIEWATAIEKAYTLMQNIN